MGNLIKKGYTIQFTTIQQGDRVSDVISVRVSCSDDRVEGAHGKRGNFQSTSRRGKLGFLFALLPREENRQY